MSGNSLLLDTNIILYILNGDETLAEILRFKKLYISFITQLEILSYTKISQEQKLQINAFLNECLIVDINDRIKDIVIDIRRKYKLKLPDSIIAATALHLTIPLISADKNFVKIQEASIIQYFV